MIFTAAETAYLQGQQLGRLATVQPDGTLQVSPVGFQVNEDEGTIDVRGFGMAKSRKFRNVEDNGQVAFVVDDVPSLDPYQVRCLEVRGTAEAVQGVSNETTRGDGAVIRIRPKRIISFGINDEFDITKLTAHNRDV